jgi:hypothetical protein
MDDPAQEEEPEDTGQDELDDRHEQAPLKQLPQAGNEKATERCYDIARGSLSCHVASFNNNPRVQNPSWCLTTLRVSGGRWPSMENMGVDHRHRDIAMAQRLLDHSNKRGSPPSLST